MNPLVMRQPLNAHNLSFRSERTLPRRFRELEEELTAAGLTVFANELSGHAPYSPIEAHVRNPRGVPGVSFEDAAALARERGFYAALFADSAAREARKWVRVSQQLERGILSDVAAFHESEENRGRVVLAVIAPRVVDDLYYSAGEDAEQLERVAALAAAALKQDYAAKPGYRFARAARREAKRPR